MTAGLPVPKSHTPLGVGTCWDSGNLGRESDPQRGSATDPHAADTPLQPTPNGALQLLLQRHPRDDDKEPTMTTSPEHPAATHRGSVAMVAHTTRGDAEAAAVLLSEISGPETRGSADRLVGRPVQAVAVHGARPAT